MPILTQNRCVGMALANLCHLAFYYSVPATSNIYTLSLHDALPISFHVQTEERGAAHAMIDTTVYLRGRSEEHTSELQSRFDLVCRLLLEKKSKLTDDRLRIGLHLTDVASHAEARKRIPSGRGLARA